MGIVRVALDIPLHTLFDYSTEVEIAAGLRVEVPFGRKQVVGVVMECSASSAFELGRIRPVTRVLDDVEPLPPDLLTLLRFCGDYYRFPLGATVMAALPARMRSGEPVATREVVRYALTESGRSLDISALPARKVVQNRVLAALSAGSRTAAELRALSSSAPAALKVLQQAGWVEVAAGPESTVACEAEAKVRFENAHELTAEQQAAFDAVSQAQGYGCFLLHGITGSGKTEVYVHLMHHALQRGLQVLLLVPEINLTPQLEQYFQARFPGADLVSLHSGLGDAERMQNWLHAQSGAANIVLGTRLAVFTPLPRLGLIIVDEEHDASFKQQDGLRYSARDVAIFRASQAGIPILLGSATPSLESYHNARTGRYALLRLTSRAAADARLPVVRCIDIARAHLPDGLSPQLLAEMEQRMARREQSLVFINRRGYAPVLMCGACGWLSGCPHCAGKLVLHQRDKRLRCHHCGHQQRVPHACPSCGNVDLLPLGSGTQRVEEALQQRFPEARILRVDRDSTRNKGAWAAMRRQIHDAEVDILVGTQMLAKGHDFPRLTLVGVLNPDGALYSSDFRASEKLFAQLAQVAGRAGRADIPGEVLIQTAFPAHPLFHALRTHDYDAWAAILLDERRVAGFPPYSYQALLRAEAREEALVQAFLRQAREAALALQMPVEVYGVVPAPMPKRAGYYLAQLLVQADVRRPLQQFLRAWQPALDALPAQKLRWSLDVDPLEL